MCQFFFGSTMNGIFPPGSNFALVQITLEDFLDLNTDMNIVSDFVLLLIFPN